MTDRPREIWCDTGLYWDYVEDWSEGSWRDNDDSGGEKYVRADRIEELEAKLAKAENGLFTLSHIHDGNPSDARADILPLDYARHMLWEARSIARATLAELKGQDDENMHR